MRQIHQSYYEAGLSSDSTLTNIFFFEEMNLVVVREKSEKRTFYRFYGGTPENRELAQKEIERESR